MKNKTSKINNGVNIMKRVSALSLLFFLTLASFAQTETPKVTITWLTENGEESDLPSNIFPSTAPDRLTDYVMLWDVHLEIKVRIDNPSGVTGTIAMPAGGTQKIAKVPDEDFGSGILLFQRPITLTGEPVQYAEGLIYRSLVKDEVFKPFYLYDFTVERTSGNFDLVSTIDGNPLNHPSGQERDWLRTVLVYKLSYDELTPAAPPTVQSLIATNEAVKSLTQLNPNGPGGMVLHGGYSDSVYEFEDFNDDPNVTAREWVVYRVGKNDTANSVYQIEAKTYKTGPESKTFQFRIPDWNYESSIHTYRFFVQCRSYNKLGVTESQLFTDQIDFSKPSHRQGGLLIEAVSDPTKVRGNALMLGKAGGNFVDGAQPQANDYLSYRLGATNVYEQSDIRNGKFWFGIRQPSTNPYSSQPMMNGGEIFFQNNDQWSLYVEQSDADYGSDGQRFYPADPNQFANLNDTFSHIIDAESIEEGPDYYHAALRYQGEYGLTDYSKFTNFRRWQVMYEGFESQFEWVEEPTSILEGAVYQVRLTINNETDRIPYTSFWIYFTENLYDPNGTILAGPKTPFKVDVVDIDPMLSQDCNGTQIVRHEGNTVIYSVRIPDIVNAKAFPSNPLDYMRLRAKIYTHDAWDTSPVCGPFLSDFHHNAGTAGRFAILDAAPVSLQEDPYEYLDLVTDGYLQVKNDGTPEFKFLARHIGVGYPLMQWRWKRVVDGVVQYWVKGEWHTNDDPNNTWIDDWYYVGTGDNIILEEDNNGPRTVIHHDPFSAAWRLRNDEKAPPEVSLAQVSHVTSPWGGLMDQFFGNGRQQTVRVETRIKWPEQDWSDVIFEDITLTRPRGGTPTDVTVVLEKTDGTLVPADVVRWHTNNVPQRMHLRFDGGLTYDQTYYAALYQKDQNGEFQALTDLSACFQIDGNPKVGTWLSEVTPNENVWPEAESVESDTKLYYLQTESNFLQLLQLEGQYRIKIFEFGCDQSGDLVEELDIRVNPPQAFTVRFHFNDHLGSTGLTQAYSVLEDPTNTTGGQMQTISLAGNYISLYPQKQEQTYFEPYGSVIASAGDGTKARYTGHEIDQSTGFVYMKGRFHIPEAGRFNRPDPARDWDWENPHSMNLYQYVRNNPINGTDPTGLEIKFKQTLDDNSASRMLSILQMLTSDELIYEDGRIQSFNAGQEVDENTPLPKGTELVRRLINDNNIVTLDFTTEGSYAESLFPDYVSDGTGSDVNVFLNEDQAQETGFFVLDPDSGFSTFQEGTLVQLVLGHELIHADRMTRGVATPANQTKTHKIVTMQGEIKIETRVEELITIGIITGPQGDEITERDLSIEQGGPIRNSH